MTLEEAIKFLGTAIIAALMRVPGQEMISLQLYHVIIQEWMDGEIDVASPEMVKKLADQYGTNTFQQAARVIADKVKLYGDVE